MTTSKFGPTVLRPLSAALAVAASIAACTSGEPPSETTSTVSSAIFVNGGFETGAEGAAPPSWTVNHFINNGITVQTPQTIGGLNLQAGGLANTVILSANGAGPGSQNDMAIGSLLTWPRYGQQCAVVNGPNAPETSGNPNTNGANKNVNELSQTMTIGAGDVDPADGQVHIRFAVAPVLMNPAHTSTEQPYYMVVVTDLTKGTILYSDFNLSGAGIPWLSTTINGNVIDYTAWQLVDIAPGATGISMGDMVEMQIYASGCSPGAHWGEIYVDGIGPTIPGLSVQGTGPTQANAGSNITYTFTYRNGSTSSESGVTIDFTTPANTTFQSIAFPAGVASCTPLAVGATGTISCTLSSSLAASASGTFQLTVNINGGTTGDIHCSNYDIKSAQETALLGTPIVTQVGCTTDTQCLAGNWCNETAGNCTPTLANGSPVPTDPSHTNPTLNGTCTAAAGTLTCSSGACDTADNDCGYKNGDGPCTSGATGNGSKVCRSGACDPDQKCGYANGDGPCAPGATGNGATVCRSGFCSENDLCEPAGECFVDSDCPLADWCIETTHVCAPKETNGTQVPTDPAHSNPTLNGTCTASDGPVGPTVCASGVCDANDGKCGYANGDGPCTSGASGDGSTVCRSGACSTNGTCEPLGGCNVDADCTGGDWCMESTHTCTPRLANGVALPTDGTHLNGMCSSGEASLVCVSGVCDTDNKCGYLNGDGSCTPASPGVCRSGVCDTDQKCGYANGDGPCTSGPSGNGAVVCRSTACSTSGTCEPLGGCDVDSDCPSGDWCMESTRTCMAQLGNGVAVPTDPPHTNPKLQGMCTVAAGLLVCTSGVCDTNDNECGYANGDGPCTPGPSGNGAVVCRSTACSSNLSCEPAGGCNVDADCRGAMWCDESTHTCMAELANGVAVPTDPPHTNPALNGICTAAAGLLVCMSGVCDTNDNECGYANGDGPCSGGDAGGVCRSGACSTNDTCKPTGGCNVDADCSTGNWCSESTHTCTPTLANGSPVPNDPAHTNPTLNGICTAAAGLLVCMSGVCDTNDNECGYANGDGPCTPPFEGGAGNGGVVCRSGMCSLAGTCEPAKGCNEDADCTSGMWCDISMNVCKPRLVNGAAMPSDPDHMNPTLNGKCAAAAAMLVCQSGVCDTSDNKCGYANGDGPCSEADGGAVVCRSGMCSLNGTCEPSMGCNTNGDCTDPVMPICDPSTHACVPAPDAGSDAGPAMDSGLIEDATTQSAGPDASESGYLQGGGCAVAQAPARDSAALGWIAVVGIALGTRRRARRNR